jgi:hypothetical protein
MVRHVIRNVALAALASALLASGCEEETEAGRVALSAMIPDPVTVSLAPTGITGTMIFDFSAHPLDLERKYDLEMMLYTGGIGVTVTNDETGVSYSLTQGTIQFQPPDSEGECQVAASEDGKTVTVSFYNAFQGAHIETGGDYSATVDVLENDSNDFFAIETFVRSVTVN